MPAALLALLASIGWGAGDFAGGLLTRRVHVAAVMVVVQAAGALGMLAVVLARGVAPAGTAVAYGAAAGVLGAIAFPCFYRALAVGTMGVIAPILATSAVVPVVVGIAFDGERPAVLQGIGVLLAVLGVVLAARAPGVDGGSSTRGVPLALLATGILGVELVLFALGSDSDPWWTVAACRWTSFALTAIAFLVLRTRTRVALPDRRTAGRLALIGVADTGANIAFAVATSTGLLSLVAVLGSLAPVVTVGLARVVLGERLSAGQGAGVLLALVGVAAIVVG